MVGERYLPARMERAGAARARDPARPHRIVGTIVGLTIAIDVVAAVLGVLDRSVQSLVATVMFSAVTVGFAAVGALIVWRQRGNAIGWAFVSGGPFLPVG